MDVAIWGEDCERVAERACRMIFSEDYKRGPVRECPPVLAQIRDDWPAHKDDVVSIGLQMPPRSPLNGLKLNAVHLVTVLAGGKKVGVALRMSDADITTLDAYTAAWATHRRVHAH